MLNPLSPELEERPLIVAVPMEWVPLSTAIPRAPD